MHKYIFRADSWYDASKAVVALSRSFLAPSKMSTCLINQLDSAAVEVEFTHELELGEIRDRLRRVEDGHTMVETVALAINYTGERVPEEPEEPSDPLSGRDPFETDAPQLTSYGYTAEEARRINSVEMWGHE